MAGKPADSVGLADTTDMPQLAYMLQPAVDTTELVDLPELAELPELADLPELAELLELAADTMELAAGKPADSVKNITHSVYRAARRQLRPTP